MVSNTTFVCDGLNSASLRSDEQPSMPAIYAALAQDGPRNEIISDDVLTALEANRSPVVLTERRDHLQYLENAFTASRRTWSCCTAA